MIYVLIDLEKDECCTFPSLEKAKEHAKNNFLKDYEILDENGNCVFWDMPFKGLN